MNPLRPAKQISPIVITSKAAQDDFLNIKSHHDDLLRSYSEHSMRVQQYNADKAAKMASDNAVKGEMDKAKMTANTETQKMALDHQTRMAEIDLKRSALTMK